MLLIATDLDEGTAFTFQPPANQRNCWCARVRAASTAVSQEIGSCPTLRAVRRVRLAPSQAMPSSRSGSTAIITSAFGANAATDCWPLTATPDRAPLWAERAEAALVTP